MQTATPVFSILPVFSSYFWGRADGKLEPVGL
jgi:hypothetical protein